MLYSELITKISIIFIIVFNTSAFIKIDLKRCKKKINVGLTFINLRVSSQKKNFEISLRPYSSDFDKKREELISYGKIVSIKKNIFVNDPETKDLIIHSTIDTSTEDVSSEISEIISIVTDINKEALVILQSIIREYFKYNIYEQLNKKFQISFETRDIIILIIRNVIIPTLIHDTFQSFFNYLKSMY